MGHLSKAKRLAVIPLRKHTMRNHFERVLNWFHIVRNNNDSLMIIYDGLSTGFENSHLSTSTIPTYHTTLLSLNHRTSQIQGIVFYGTPSAGISFAILTVSSDDGPAYSSGIYSSSQNTEPFVMAFSRDSCT